MRIFAARNLSLLLMLAAFPLISLGTTQDRPALWWLGLASLAFGALIPPALRFVPKAESEGEQKEEAHSATDLGESSRVC